MQNQQARSVCIINWSYAILNTKKASCMSHVSFSRILIVTNTAQNKQDTIKSAWCGTMAVIRQVLQSVSCEMNPVKGNSYRNLLHHNQQISHSSQNSHIKNAACERHVVSVVDCVWNVMAHAQKPDFVFRPNGRVYLNRRGRQFSRLLAAELCASAVAMLDTPCSEVVWKVLATHSIRQFPLHFTSRASTCAITFQLDSTAESLI
jgi:hypothetical protein